MEASSGGSNTVKNQIHNNMEKFTELKELIASAESDATAFFEKNNGAAGTRLRNALQKTKTLAQDIRNEVTKRTKNRHR